MRTILGLHTEPPPEISGACHASANLTEILPEALWCIRKRVWCIRNTKHRTICVYTNQRLVYNVVKHTEKCVHTKSADTPRIHQRNLFTINCTDTCAWLVVPPPHPRTESLEYNANPKENHRIAIGCSVRWESSSAWITRGCAARRCGGGPSLWSNRRAARQGLPTVSTDPRHPEGLLRRQRCPGGRRQRCTTPWRER